MEFKGKRDLHAASDVNFSAEDVLSIMDHVSGRRKKLGSSAQTREFLLPFHQEPMAGASALGWLLNQAAIRYRDFFRQNAVASQKRAASARSEIRECCGRLIAALGYRLENGLQPDVELIMFLDLKDFEREEIVSRGRYDELVTTFDRSAVLCEELLELSRAAQEPEPKMQTRGDAPESSHAANEGEWPKPGDPLPTGEWARDWLIDDLEKIYSLIWDKKAAASFNEATGAPGPFLRFMERTDCRIARHSMTASALSTALKRKRKRAIPNPYPNICHGVEVATRKEIARREADPMTQKRIQFVQKIGLK